MGRSQWVIWLLLPGVAYGIVCENATEVSDCYEDLVNYESLSLPLYGNDEVSLDDTCEHMASSFQCIRSYYEACERSPDCGEECGAIRRDIGVFLSNSGLERFAGDLCAEDSPLRQTYLENVLCLESIADEFAACHNDSQKSLSYLHNISHTEDTTEARCCYSSWYDQCFTNATRDSCGENATMFVSYATHKLVVDMTQHYCADAPKVCREPPLPTDMPTESDVDNEIPDEIEGKPKGGAAASAHFGAATGVAIAQCLYILLSKYVL